MTFPILAASFLFFSSFCCLSSLLFTLPFSLWPCNKGTTCVLRLRSFPPCFHSFQRHWPFYRVLLSVFLSCCFDFGPTQTATTFATLKKRRRSRVHIPHTAVPNDIRSLWRIIYWGKSEAGPSPKQASPSSPYKAPKAILQQP